MPPPQAPDTLPPDVAAKMAEFSRACKAATRIVSLYPASHPAIQSALSRIVEAGRQVVANGPCVIAVLPDNLLIGGQSAAKADQSVGELAQLLHRQQIAGITLQDTLDAAGWHRFLSLLARAPAETRLAGGVAKAWAESGGGPVEVTEIDYAEVLREGTGSGDGASWDRIVADWLEEGPAEGADRDLASVLEIAGDPARIAELAAKLQERAGGSGESGELERGSMVRALHGLANYAAQQSAGTLDATMQRMAGAAMQLSPDVLFALLTDPPPLPAAQSDQPRVDVAGELQRHLSDEAIGHYVADNVVKDRGATTRLATAFHTLVPDPARRQEVLALARRDAERSALGADPQFENVWTNSMNLLTSYSDKQYVSDDYARELTEARTQAVAVERIGDLPPARLRAWMSTVSEPAIRALDQRVLLDLLAIEQRPDAWAGVLDGAGPAIERLVAAGDLSLARELLDAVVAAAQGDHQQQGEATIARLAAGPFVKQLAVMLRRISDAEAEVANAMCRTIGPALVKPLADALAVEDNARVLRRLRDVLISFGPAARTYADELRSSANPAVRRAAIDLLRALGGHDALPDLRGMLDDADSQVQREALRAIVQIGTDEAFHLLQGALETGSPRMREAIIQTLGSLRDERAAPLFVHILEHSSYTGAFEALYLSTIEALGRVGGGDSSASTLGAILHRGQWWAPGRTTRLRTAAARALRAFGTPTADRVLQEAASSGPSGVRRVARAALAEAPPRLPTSRTV